jgi:decaprenyl-phosphate phosphoribosyltransferase
LNTIEATAKAVGEARPPTEAHAAEASIAGASPARADAAPRASRALYGLRPAARASALLRAMRPRQWVKNVLVVAVPGAAGVLTHPGIALKVTGAFVCFCLLSSCAYLVNDVHDRVKDAGHPRKRARPIAAGEVSAPLALSAAAGLGVAGLGIAFAIRPLLGVTGLGYLFLTASYSLWLRDIAVADIAIVASGFVLRALAGGAATGVPVSRWFVMVTSFGALFLVSGKRYAELRSEGASASTRASLRAYSEDYLRFAMILAASVTTVAYCLWAFQGHHHDGLSWYEATVAPFLLWLLRYAFLIHEGGGEAPEDIVLRDRFLIAMSGAWVAIYACAVYVAT